MRFPYVLPRRIIEIVEIVLSTSFCAVPALRRVDPAMNSGPTTTAISWSTSAPSSEADAATTQAVSAPALLGRLERTEHVGRRPARADADDGIGRRRPRAPRRPWLRPRGRPRRRPARAGERSRRPRRARRPCLARSRTSLRTRMRRAPRSDPTSRRRRRRGGRPSAVARRSASTAAAIADDASATAARHRRIRGVDQRDELLGLAALVARSRVAPRLRDQRVFDHRASLRCPSSGGQYQL